MGVLGSQRLQYCRNDVCNCYSTAEMTYADFTALILLQVCAHRLVNGYCRNDWVLGFIYRAGTLLRTVAGLRPITASGKDDLHTGSSSTIPTCTHVTAQESTSPHASPSTSMTAADLRHGSKPLHPAIENL